ncbi:MAG: tRNA 2-thiouridine(34) synthase MnmA [Candidatus Cloacimonetes bacterium]|nr:tRNA 2-thiouridine(34) synthase MnmA [Candidatus Cloacimonadota bacterium]
MKIALGLSGGVDSTICAMLLKEAGHEVIGITMRKWSAASGILSADKRGCFGPSEPQALKAAKETAARLGIAHYEIDLEKEFKAEILSYYRQSYAAGLTPNPCVFCNQKIKFGALLKSALNSGINFDRFATGHYARTSYNEELGRWQLFKAKDANKDQSYFLSGLKQEQLALSLFPLGELLKTEIKAYAEARGFAYLIKKKESQNFLESYDNSPLFEANDAHPGYFIDKNGKILGEHKGLIHYTVGQRKGLGLKGFPEAQYVIRLDNDTNNILVGNESELYSDKLRAININWLSIPAPGESFACRAKIRLAQEPEACNITPLPDGSSLVRFDKPISAITPGQIVAFYKEDMVLGMGEISR